MIKLPFPDHVEIELTNACNISCVMCPRPFMKRQVKHMSFELFKKIVDECKGQVNSIYLHQFGEPLIHPKLIECINYISEVEIHTSLSTNCTLLKGQLAIDIAKSGLDEIVLCLDSLIEDTYESLRVGATFADVLKNIHEFLAIPGRRVKAVVQIIELSENEGELKDFVIPGADEILIKPYTNWAGALAGEDQEWRYKCDKLDHCLTVQSNGNVVLCCRDLEGVTKIGSVLDSSLLDLWNSYGQLYSRDLPFCARC